MEGTIMPLNLADFNKKYRISKVCGQEKQRHYLESWDLYVEVKSSFCLKFMAITLSWLREAKSIEKSMAKRIILHAA